MEHGKIIEYGIYNNLLRNGHSRVHDFAVKNLRYIWTNHLLPKNHRIVK
jgi:hypothetical protein